MQLLLLARKERSEKLNCSLVQETVGGWLA